MKRLAILMLAASILVALGCSTSEQQTQEQSGTAEEQVFGDDFEAGSTEEWNAEGDEEAESKPEQEVDPDSEQ